MTDVFTVVKRSEVMSRIRGFGNRATEMRMILLFRRFQIRGWRRKQKLFGKPDFVFRHERVTVFVDGCFWHGCPKPKHASRPKNRADWWLKNWKATSGETVELTVCSDLRDGVLLGYGNVIWQRHPTGHGSLQE